MRTGADRVWDEPYRQWIAGKRVGLITNHTGVDSGLRLTAHRMRDSPAVDLTAVFGPEHGFAGMAQAGEEVASQTDERQSAPGVYSL
ncbi:MAG TPA: exo-beta-N-acetylmuramidase NamZ domain-containing protein, partial [Acidobacteriota bacterium]|nr:exo-beta-N-acetylmuramidase NamZ domain-containing protein [Acidobacteriota bacterium]